MFIRTKTKKIKLIVQEEVGDHISKNWKFLNRIRYNFALDEVMEKVSERTKEEDGVKYKIEEYHFIINKLELPKLKMYIEYVTDFVSFTAEIEELY